MHSANYKIGANMRRFATVLFSMLVLTACSPTPQPTLDVSSGVSPQSMSLEDIDYQITITKQAIERYKTQVYVTEEQADSVMSRDFMGYREDTTQAQQEEAIVKDLEQRLQQLEDQRAQMIKKSN
jgi:hypothetical protein